MAIYSSGVGPQSYPTARASTRNTQVPQYSNYQPGDPRLNSNDPAVLQSMADEINARNAEKLGMSGDSTWYKPMGEGGGYSQVLNPTDYTGLVQTQGAMPDYMMKGGLGGKGAGSSNMLANDVIAKMWK
jgi:hypothetical protein